MHILSAGNFGKMRITQGDIKRFTTGDCHFLAMRIHRTTGLPIHAFMMRDDPKPTRHAFVIIGDQALDVRGLTDLKTFKFQWDAKAISDPLTPDWLHGNWNPRYPQFGHYTYARARLIARHFVKQYQLDNLLGSPRM